jgi:hypothetical protein
MPIRRRKSSVALVLRILDCSVVVKHSKIMAIAEGFLVLHGNTLGDRGTAVVATRDRING